MKTPICFFLFLFIFTPLLWAQNYQYKGQIISLLNAEEKDGFSGTVLIFQDGKIQLNEGYGFTDKQQLYKVEPSTIFNIASITKSFTAIGILQLIEQGKLNLEDRLSSFFEEVPQDKKDISIHQLLSHSSGLSQSYVCMRKSERTACMEEIWKEKLEKSSGHSFRYSNHNYAILAAIIEVVSGSSWEEYLSKNILKPAMLNNTYFWGSIDDRNAAKVAQKINKLGKKTRQRNWDYLGGGGMYSTTEDLYKWFQSLQAGNFLSEKYQKLLFTPTLYSRSGLGIGYGWFISQTEGGAQEYWTRGSDSFGHNAVLRWFPEKETLVIVCTNTGEKGGKTKTDNRRISDLIIDIIL